MWNSNTEQGHQSQTSAILGDGNPTPWRYGYETVIAQDEFDETVTTQVFERAVTIGRKRSCHGLRATEVRYLPVLKSLLIGFVDRTGPKLSGTG